MLPMNNKIVKQKKTDSFTKLSYYAKQVGKGALLFTTGLLGYFGISAIFVGKQKQTQITANKNINENKLSTKFIDESSDEISTTIFEELDEVSNKFVPLSSFNAGKTLLSVPDIKKAEDKKSIKKNNLGIKVTSKSTRREIEEVEESPQGGCEFQINSYTTNNQQYPSVVGLADGGFVVTWMSEGQDGDLYGIYCYVSE